MKIALLYSGHLRSLEKTSSLHNNFMNELKTKHDVKVFCQTWNEPEATTKTWWNNFNDINKEIYLPSKLLMNNINHLDSFIISEKKTIYDDPDYFESEVAFDGMVSMYHALNESYNLFKNYSSINNWDADIVVRMRYDIDFDSILLVNAIEEAFKKNNSLFFSTIMYDLYDSFTDVLFILNAKEKYECFFNRLNLFLEDDFLKLYFKKYKLFIPEIFISEYILLDKNVNKFFLQINIVRLNGEILKVSSDSKLETLKNALFKSHFLKKIVTDEKTYYEQLNKYLFSYQLIDLFPFLYKKINLLNIFNLILLVARKKIDKELFYLCLRKSLDEKQNRFLNTLIRIICKTENYIVPKVSNIIYK